MTLRDDIVHHLRLRPAGMSDAELARAIGKLHQQVNRRCRALEDEGVLTRDGSSGVILNRLSPVEDPPPRDAAPPSQASAQGEWFWEGNVQALLCTWLVRQGWSLVQVMNTAMKQQGTDIGAQRAGVRLHVEVKGYPSKSYADPRRADEVKRTNPSVQAKHWYADALLKVVCLREKHPEDAVAMAFPNAPRYRTLLEDTRRALRTLRIDVFLVEEDGSVEAW